MRCNKCAFKKMFEPDNGVLNPHLRDESCRNYYVNKLTVVVK